MLSGGPTRRQLLLSTLIPFLLGLVLRGLHVAPSLGIAIVVAGTMVSLVGRIIVDGQTLDLLEVQRRLAVDTQAEAAVRMLMSDVLGELGHRILEAADGAAGLLTLRSPARVDLLITDVELPGD